MKRAVIYIFVLAALTLSSCAGSIFSTTDYGYDGRYYDNYYYGYPYWRNPYYYGYPYYYNYPYYYGYPRYYYIPMAAPVKPTPTPAPSRREIKPPVSNYPAISNPVQRGVGQQNNGSRRK